MNSSKPIDISKSSLVGLKAELLRKQEEVKRLKELKQDNVKPEIIPKKKSVLEKSNDGVEKRSEKDVSVAEEDFDALQKSREVLEAKSRLYDKLKGKIVDEETKSRYLIDFDLKRELDMQAPPTVTINEEASKHSEDEEDYSDSNSDPENDWVDFVDTLGRSRRCLRKDLPEMKDKDAKLAVTLHPPSPPPDKTSTPTPELLSWDMQREMMRKKWEEEETLLLSKKDVHYQDVRFDEARPHGVGYFEFSTDEAERIRQQQELQKLRAQTEEQQEAAKGLRARRQQQMQARLAAARRRRRERLGLPPESPPQEVETPTIPAEEEKVVEEESIIELEESVKKIAPIRPWDIGKNAVAPVMSQEEWVEKKRQERPAEFAPPSNLTETDDPEEYIEQKWKSNPNIFTSKKPKHKSLFNEKSKRKHKKLKDKKLREMEEVDVGPSVKDWQEVSQGDTADYTVSKISHNFTQEPSDKSSRTSCEPQGPSECDEVFGPSKDQTKEWKPTITDIDLLLSQSRAATFNTPVEQEVSDHALCDNPTMPIGSQESADRSLPVHINNTSTSKYTVKSRNYNDRLSTNSRRTEHHETSMNLGSDSFNSETVIRPIANLLEVDSDDELEESSKKRGNDDSISGKWKSSKRKFAEIPPPPSMSYYTDTEKKNKPNVTSKPQLADSISAGINYLKTQTEEKSKKRLKGMLDII